MCNNISNWCPMLRSTRYGQRSFAVSAPTLWNTLPPTTPDPSLTLTQFCALLESVLFCRAYETLPQHLRDSLGCEVWSPTAIESTSVIFRMTTIHVVYRTQMRSTLVLQPRVWCYTNTIINTFAPSVCLSVRRNTDNILIRNRCNIVWKCVTVNPESD